MPAKVALSAERKAEDELPGWTNSLEKREAVLPPSEDAFTSAMCSCNCLFSSNLLGRMVHKGEIPASSVMRVRRLEGQRTQPLGSQQPSALPLQHL